MHDQNETTKTCPRCRLIVDAGVARCGCGHPFADHAEPRPCIVCAAPMPEGARFCSRCGRSVGSSILPVVQRPLPGAGHLPRRKERPSAPAIVLVGALAALAVAGVTLGVALSLREEPVLRPLPATVVIQGAPRRAGPPLTRAEQPPPLVSEERPALARAAPRRAPVLSGYFAGITNDMRIRIKGRKEPVSLLKLKFSVSRQERRSVPFTRDNARREMRALLSRGRITLLADPRWDPEVSGYHVFVDGQLVSVSLLLEGLAVIDGYYDRFRYREEMRAAQLVAQEKRRGMWGFLRGLTPPIPVSPLVERALRGNRRSAARRGRASSRRLPALSAINWKPSSAARSIASVSLVAATWSEDWVVRARSLRTLGDRREYRAIPRLTEMLADPSPFVRADAIRALVELRAHTAIPALMNRYATLSSDRNRRKENYQGTDDYFDLRGENADAVARKLDRVEKKAVRGALIDLSHRRFDDVGDYSSWWRENRNRTTEDWVRYDVEEWIAETQRDTLRAGPLSEAEEGRAIAEQQRQLDAYQRLRDTFGNRADNGPQWEAFWENNRGRNLADVAVEQYEHFPDDPDAKRGAEDLIVRLIEDENTDSSQRLREIGANRDQLPPEVKALSGRVELRTQTLDEEARSLPDDASATNPASSANAVGAGAPAPFFNAATGARTETSAGETPKSAVPGTPPSSSSAPVDENTAPSAAGAPGGAEGGPAPADAAPASAPPQKPAAPTPAPPAPTPKSPPAAPSGGGE